MSHADTAQALAAVLQDHRTQLIDTLVQQAPAAGSEYAHASQEELWPRMASVVDACIGSIAQQQPDLLGRFMRAAAESRIREGYSLESLITLAMFIEGALSDTAEIAFETQPADREAARSLIRSLIATAETVLDEATGTGS
ncbi:MAG TPA: hypothetical protein VM536_16210 [Chloroflexia bacterium]|nr:hypothetical protein [Chloroflexia bacterium]